MRNKIISIVIIVLILFAAIPLGLAQKTNPTITKESMFFSYVVIEGNPIIPLFIGYHFIAGFGKLSLMRARLDNTGHIEINKLFENSDTIILDGSRVVLIIGFIGHLRWEEGKLLMYGLTTFISC